MRTHPSVPLRLLALAAAALLAACGDDAIAPATTSLDGTWGPATSVVGSRWDMQLHEAGTALSGTGTYAFEAGRSGTFTVTGTAAGADVSLDIVYDYGLRERFTGTHTALDVLHGHVVRTLGADTTAVDEDLYRRADR